MGIGRLCENRRGVWESTGWGVKMFPSRADRNRRPEWESPSEWKSSGEWESAGCMGIPGLCGNRPSAWEAARCVEVGGLGCENVPLAGAWECAGEWKQPSEWESLGGVGIGGLHGDCRVACEPSGYVGIVRLSGNRRAGV